MTIESHIVSVSVAASADATYQFAARMENLPRWASGLASGLSREGPDWFTESPMGRVKVAMVPVNPYRVLDHDVTLPDGTTVHNAFRVTPTGEGCLLCFVVLRMPGTDAPAFAADIAHVEKDLQALKAIVEQGGAATASP